MRKQRHTPHRATRLVGIAWVVLLGWASPFVATAQYKVVHLDKPYNTTGSETSALRVGDTTMVYASLAPNTSNTGAFGLKHKLTHIYQARIARNGKISRPKHDRWGICNDKDHTGNLALDPVNHDLYFTRGNAENLRCDIWYARKKKRRGWEKPVRLRGSVNNKQYTATHPTIGRLPDGTTVLYFVSDRPGGLGGMDIWQCTVSDGIASEPTNLGPQVNSASDEYTPFYDQRNGILYFSSDREGGMGGFDIYCAMGQRNTWQAAEPVCGCLNSEQNDLYFNISDYDSASGFPTGGYLCSNRHDSFFLSDSMCCNDIYRWGMDSAQWLIVQDEPDTATSAPDAFETISRFFPLYLYFHNDDPDPRSQDSLTVADYADCQLRYALLRSRYLAHQHTAADSATITLFFDTAVVGNFVKVNTLLDYVEEQLDEGKRVVLTVAGYASPVFHDEYNRILSQRRIGSFVNMIRSWRGGMFYDALANGRLRIVQEPRGEVPESDESRQSDAVYSLPAAQARRIEITRCEIF